MLPEHFHDHGYFTARVGKIGHNTFEHAISWDVSKFALSRQPEARFHFPGYLPGIDLSEVRDNTWTKGSEKGMSRAEVLAAVGRRAGLPLSWRATTESPRMTPDGTTATRIIQLLAEKQGQAVLHCRRLSQATPTMGGAGHVLRAASGRQDPAAENAPW